MRGDRAPYAEWIDALSPENRALLEAEWPEAVRALSPRGLDNWIKGAVALQRIGRGESIVAAWIEEVPAVAREVGEDVVGDFAQQCLLFASRTSAAVIELIIGTAPVAAKRLGDAELFRAYWQLLNVLLGQAPRALRPMLEHLEELLGVLTLGGLRRWALWGAQAHRTNVDEQLRYFSLASEESKAVLQQERKGTLFVDVHRRIGMYLRALWGRDFFMRPTAGDFERRDGMRPFIEGFFLHLPDAYDEGTGADGRRISGLDCYRAAAAHGAAHVVATTARIEAERLTALQQACVGVFEDARVEALAIARFPRLRDLWLPFHPRSEGAPDSAGAWFDRIARALLDPAEDDADPLVAWAREAFSRVEWNTNAGAVSLGLTLADRLTAMHVPFSPYRDGQTALYRDDNRYLWSFEPHTLEEALAAVEPARTVRRYVSPMELANEVEVETAGDDAQEIWVCATEFFDDDGVSFNQKEGREPVSEPRHYHEFDYLLQLDRPVWTTVLEKRPKRGDPALVEGILQAHRPVTQRLKRLLDALQPQGTIRVRKLEDGDEIDLEAAVRSLTDARLGFTPDPRVMMRSVRHTRDIAVLVLLDLSASTNDPVAGQDYTVLDLTRAATVLLADAIHQVGDAFAVHGFFSDGRHNVFYQRFKDFTQPWGEVAKARLAGMEGRLSTRLGAAIRHAGHHLSQVRAARKLLLVVTDGEPADVDVRDPQYLHWDAKRAVEEVTRAGVTPFCLTLDPRADRYVSRIFGLRHYLILDHVQRLPERLPLLYTTLTR